MSLFAPYHFYRHQNMLDAKIQVLKSFRVPGEGRYKLKVAWWTSGPLGIVERIEIKREQIRYWEEVPYNPNTGHRGLELESEIEHHKSTYDHPECSDDCLNHTIDCQKHTSEALTPQG